jgi:hypothetical protein
MAGYCIFAQVALDHNLPTYTFCLVGMTMTGMCHHRWDHTNFLPRLAWTMVLLSSQGHGFMPLCPSSACFIRHTSPPCYQILLSTESKYLHLPDIQWPWRRAGRWKGQEAGVLLEAQYMPLLQLGR